MEVIQGLLDQLGRGIDQVPPAIRAMVLLGAPTIAWIITRVIMGPRRRVAGEFEQDTSWVCAECMSINPPRQRRCYRCRADNPAELVEVDAAGRPTPVAYPVGYDDGGAWAAEYDDEEYEDEDEDDESAEYDDEEYEDEDDDEEETGVAVGPARHDREPVGIPIEPDEPAVVTRRPPSRRADVR